MKDFEPAGSRVEIADVIARARSAGSHFFDPETMKFFKSQIHGTGIADGKGNTYFVTSEKFVDRVRGTSLPRRYTVQVQKPDGHIETVGEFQAYKTARRAFEARDEAASLSENPRSRSRYTHIRVTSPTKFARKSFRTIDVGRPGHTKLVVACPKGQYVRGRCKVGMKKQAILKERRANAIKAQAFIVSDIAGNKIAEFNHWDDAVKWARMYSNKHGVRLQVREK